MQRTKVGLTWLFSYHKQLWSPEAAVTYLTGLNDLKGLVQPRQFYDCMIEISHFSV